MSVFRSALTPILRSRKVTPSSIYHLHLSRSFASQVPRPDPSLPPQQDQINTNLSPRLQKYSPRLYALSQRTGVPLSSLALSFLILHELTAIIPLILVFWLFQALGTGAAFVEWIKGISEGEYHNGGVDASWDWRGKVSQWMEEGEKRVERVGKRYGILGYDKVKKRSDEPNVAVSTVEQVEDEINDVIKKGGGAAGSVTNGIAAYIVIKALLPVRIGFSIAAAPAFARLALSPFRKLGQRLRAGNKNSSN